ncbi:hypothetical protein [Roseofilum sp. Guam]|uniref:hypothetical protein n=1 Tax=Roseofilum sp. Guam TaxID=2821502 RepID=UPI001B0564F7|nr:hypothetical protein [Roseofilum sp. Guam]MBP0029015.1 NUDIX hydrolase [Roseofilum sp. Guam]
MQQLQSDQTWKLLKPLVRISSQWMTLIGEQLEDHQGQVLDYWRVEKADSVVIVTIQGDRVILPVPQYRPGVQGITLDFAGGRVRNEGKPLEVVPHILNRELGIGEGDILQIQLLNEQGWLINSSFSNQKLYGCVAQIDPKITVERDRLGAVYPHTSEGLHQLYQDLTCLQCRAVLQEWQYSSSSGKGNRPTSEMGGEFP